FKRDPAPEKEGEKQNPKDEKQLRGNPILSSDELRGKWTGEKNGIKVDLTFSGKEARWQGHWNVIYTKARARQDPEQSPTVAARIGTDLRCAADEKTGRLSLFLPTYLGDKGNQAVVLER